MKRIFKSFTFCLAAAGILSAAAGCNDAELKPIDNAAYIAEAYRASSTILSTDNDSPTAQATLTARLGSKAESDMTFTFETDSDVLVRYNELNGTSYQQMPDEAFTLSSSSVSISEGQVSASPVMVEMSYTDEMKESGATYAIPVKLHCSEGNIPVVESNSEFVIVCNYIKPVPAPLFNYEYYMSTDWNKLNRVMFDLGDEPMTFTSYTVEFMMYVYAFSSRDNLMLVALDGQNGGLTNRMWVRFELKGDDQKNRWMQINAIKKPAVYATEANQEKVWQHVGIVFDGSGTKLYLDGKEVATHTASASSIIVQYFSLLPQPSYFSQSGMASMISFREVRLWNVARSASQLANNMNSVDPKSEGLVGYWKMDEGEGYTFTDATGNGHTGTCEYSNASDISIPWDDTNDGPATGLKWIEDSNKMEDYE